MDQTALTIVTPQRQALDTAAAWVDIPAESGQMRALPEHAPTLGTLGAGIVRWADGNGQESQLVVSGGFFEVLGDRVTLLADIAELPKEIDRAAAKARLEELRRQPPAVKDADAAHADLMALDLAQARVDVSA